MTTERQKQVFSKVIENHGNVSKSMRDVGYSANSAKNPKRNLTSSKGWQKLLQKYIPDSKLTKVLDEGMEASRELRIDGQVVAEIPDYAVRHKYLETGLKLKNKFPSEKLDLGATEELKDFLLKLNKVIDE